MRPEKFEWETEESYQKRLKPCKWFIFSDVRIRKSAVKAFYRVDLTVYVDSGEGSIEQKYKTQELAMKELQRIEWELVVNE